MERNVLEQFHPIIREWFEKNIGEPSLPQIEGWPAIQNKENVLISAPTGAGKTLSAFLECINDLFVQGISGEFEKGVQVLYISPLKALNNDIYRNLEVPLMGIEKLCIEHGVEFPNITKAVRTGDTSQSERRKMAKTPPQILITTPESLFLMLTSKNAEGILGNVKYLIIDEIHTLLGNKRGAHLSLSIERLNRLVNKPIVRIGLSATIRPLTEAAKYLGGFLRFGEAWQEREVRIIEPNMKKAVDLMIQIPVKDYRILKEGTIWNDIYKNIYELVLAHKSTIVFVNNRAVAEKVSANLNNLAGRTIARTHHGCISKESRLEVERQLKNGELPCLIATSSLELGIDIGAIDLMVQVSSPKSAARGLQRLGRAGHRMSSVSKGRIIPKTRGDLLEAAIISKEMLEGHVEEEHVPICPLDVLAQHIVSLAATGEWKIEELQELIQASYSYQTITTYELEKIFEMLSGDYEHNEDKPRSPMIIWDRINRVVRGDAYSRMLAVGGTGTIPDKGYYPVYLQDRKTRIGELDETFIYEARLGDRFMLGTSPWKIEKIERDRVIVAPCGKSGAKTPFWSGEGLGRPYELGLRFGSFLEELSKVVGTNDYMNYIQKSVPLDEIGARNLEQYILDQKKEFGFLSNHKRIVVEYFSDEVGDKRMVIHSHFGGRVNEGLAIIFEQLLSEIMHVQVQCSSNDDGILINLMGAFEAPKNIFSLVKAEEVMDTLIDVLPSTPLFSITFRYNASRALMMGMKKIGKRSPLWAQRVRGMELLQLAERYPDHPLIVETYRECMNTIIDVPHIVEVLEGIKNKEIEVIEVESNNPSPFTSELLFNFMGVAMYEGLLPNPKKQEGRLVTGKINLSFNKHEAMSKSLIDKEAILEIVSRNSPLNKTKAFSTPDQIHSFLLTYGDVSIEDIIKREEFITDNSEHEIDKKGPRIDREELNRNILKLLEQGRIFKLPMEKEYYAAAEEHELYYSALGIAVNQTEGDVANQGEGDAEGYVLKAWTTEEALYRIIRRFSRYNSPFTEEDIYKRYGVEKKSLNRILQRLKEDGMLLKGAFGEADHEEWYHTLVMEKIRLHSMQIARKAAKAQGVEWLGDFLPRFQGIGKEVTVPVENLYDIIVQLKGLYLPVDWWESFVFPTRIRGYKKSHLDKLCGSGRVIWRIKTGEGTPKLAWFLPTDIKNENGLEEKDNLLTGDEKSVYLMLKNRGASFVHGIQAATALSTVDLLNALEGLLWKGFVTNDSYEPVRYFQSDIGATLKAKIKKRTNLFKNEMGRWEAAIEVSTVTLEECLEIMLKRYGFISKEIFQYEKISGVWKEVYELLKQWEYIGKVNRGYYVEGISGIQFTLPEITSLFNVTSNNYRVLNSCDPAQVYGQIVPRDNESNPWLCNPSTAIVFRGGRVILVVEAYGERMRFQTDDKEEQIASASEFLKAFNSGSIWPTSKRIKLKLINDEISTKSIMTEELYALGFENEMMELTYWKGTSNL